MSNFGDTVFLIMNFWWHKIVPQMLPAGDKKINDISIIPNWCYCNEWIRFQQH